MFCVVSAHLCSQLMCLNPVSLLRCLPVPVWEHGGGRGRRLQPEVEMRAIGMETKESQLWFLFRTESVTDAQPNLQTLHFHTVWFRRRKTLQSQLMCLCRGVVLGTEMSFGGSPPPLSVHHVGLSWTVSVGRAAMKFGADIHGSRRLNLNDSLITWRFL